MPKLGDLQVFEEVSHEERIFILRNAAVLDEARGIVAWQRDIPAGLRAREGAESPDLLALVPDTPFFVPWGIHLLQARTWREWFGSASSVGARAGEQARGAIENSLFPEGGRPNGHFPSFAKGCPDRR
jgi:hypothetical protein